MWVPIVENNEIGSEGADYFIRKNVFNILNKDQDLDTLILGCTHYPLLLDSIKKYVPAHIHILVQGEIVAVKLLDYLERHPEIHERISRDSVVDFLTTESSETFENKAELFLGTRVSATTIHL